MPELQRLHRWHDPWAIIVADPARVRLIWSGRGTSLRNGSTFVVPAMDMVRGAVDRDPREHRHPTAALYAVLPTVGHLATLPTSHEYTARRLQAEQNRTGVTFVEGRPLALVIDDPDDTREVYATMLRVEGFTVDGDRRRVTQDPSRAPGGR